MAEKLYNASDPKHVKGRKEQERRASLRDDAAYDYVMSSVHGRHFVWLILGETGMFRTSFTGNSQTFFNEGKRDVGLKLQSVLQEKHTDNFISMWQEHLVQEKKDEAADTANRMEANNGHQNEGEF